MITVGTIIDYERAGLIIGDHEEPRLMGCQRQAIEQDFPAVVVELSSFIMDSRNPPWVQRVKVVTRNGDVGWVWYDP